MFSTNTNQSKAALLPEPLPSTSSQIHTATHTHAHTQTHTHTVPFSFSASSFFFTDVTFHLCHPPFSQPHVQSIRAPCCLHFQTIQKLTTSIHLHCHCPGLCLHSYPGLHLQPPEKYPYYLSLLPSGTHSLKTAARLIYLMRSPAYFSG